MGHGISRRARLQVSGKEERGPGQAPPGLLDLCMYLYLSAPTNASCVVH